MIPAETPRHLLLVSVGAIAAALTLSSSSVIRSHSPSSPPAGYRSVEVDSVRPLGSQYVVRLGDHHQSITMYVGSSEGLAIALHHEGRRYERPLSMELLESTLFQLGATLERVQIDTVRDHTYIGSIHLRQGDRSIEVDARPSDAVALALSKHAPILVADSVFAVAGDQGQ